MQARPRHLLLLAVAVAAVAAVVWAMGGAQRQTVERSFQQTEAAHGMLASMLDEETGLRGYVLNRRESFLEPYRSGNRALVRFETQARSTTAAMDPEIGRLLDLHADLARRWHASAERTILGVQSGRQLRVPLRTAIQRKDLMDRIRATNRRLQERFASARHEDMRRLQRLSAGLVIALAFLFGLGGWLLFGRRAELQRVREQAEVKRRERQTHFARTMQVMDGESEAHDLVRRHLERTIAASRVVVLQRNNSADRLEATAGVEAGDPLGAALADAQPRSCLAVRLGRPHAEGDAEELLGCELCGKTGRELAQCTPLLVSGEVIGSVLVAHDEPLDESARQSIGDTVTQAAPVIANMRNLAIAERRAATDALTGLPNRRAVQDTVRRMLAQAQRTGTPLAAVAIDVDHFKHVNDTYGHDRGDDVLAAIGQVLASTLRSSDFVGRQGGEEFVALLPDTDLSGALVAAENLRAAIELLEFPGFDAPVTASFGVAIHPEDGGDQRELLRVADRALYAAKERGRNRVETAATTAGAPASPQTAG